MAVDDVPVEVSGHHGRGVAEDPAHRLQVCTAAQTGTSSTRSSAASNNTCNSTGSTAAVPVGLRSRRRAGRCTTQERRGPARYRLIGLAPQEAGLYVPPSQPPGRRPNAEEIDRRHNPHRSQHPWIRRRETPLRRCMRGVRHSARSSGRAGCRGAHIRARAYHFAYHRALVRLVGRGQPDESAAAGTPGGRSGRALAGVWNSQSDMVLYAPQSLPMTCSEASS